MMVVDMYRPDQWHDFFVMVGGDGSAALTGLVFVALSLNLESIEWLVVSTFAAVMYVYGYIQALKTGRSAVGLRTEERSRPANVCSVRHLARVGTAILGANIPRAKRSGDARVHARRARLPRCSPVAN
jgi:hypothetical protein